MGFIVTQRMVIGEGKMQTVYKPLYMTKVSPHTWSGARKDSFVFGSREYAQGALDAEGFTDPQFRYAIEEVDANLAPLQT